VNKSCWTTWPCWEKIYENLKFSVGGWRRRVGNKSGRMLTIVQKVEKLNWHIKPTSKFLNFILGWKNKFQTVSFCRKKEICVFECLCVLRKFSSFKKRLFVGTKVKQKCSDKINQTLVLCCFVIVGYLLISLSSVWWFWKFFVCNQSWSVFAAHIKSFSLKPFIACVYHSIVTCR
jgi:hypothetical protein